MEKIEALVSDDDNIPKIPPRKSRINDTQGNIMKILQEEMIREHKKMMVMEEIGIALTRFRNLDDILNLMVQKITEVMEAEKCTLYLIEEETGELLSKVAQVTGVSEIRLPIGKGIAGTVAQTGQALNVRDAYQDSRFDPSFDKLTGYRTRSILCVPIYNPSRRIIGAIQVLNKKSASHFEAEDEDLLLALASEAAIAIENSKMFLSLVENNMELTDTKSKLEQKVLELDILFDMEQEISRAVQLTDLIQHILERVLAIIAAKVVTLVILNQGGKNLLYCLGEGDETVYGSVVSKENLAPFMTEDLFYGDNQMRATPDQIAILSPAHKVLLIDSLLRVPFKDQDNIIGFLEVLNKKDQDYGFSNDDFRILSLISLQITRAIISFNRREELEKGSRLANIGKMLSGILHDFRTPMTVISGYMDLMSESDNKEYRHEIVEKVMKQFDHLNNMIQETLSFAKGQSNILIRRVFMDRFIQEVAELLMQELKGTGIDLNIDLQYSGVAYFDENKMLRVFYNITRNAKQAMTVGGRLLIAVKLVEEKYLVFTFKDTGKGIPKEISDTIFESFVGLNKEGTGLGLAIVKRIIEEHQGTITFESEERKGTTFTITLPLQPRC